MGARLVSDAGGAVVRFARDARLAAFGAAELIADRLEPAPTVVPWRDRETGRAFLAIRLNAPGRAVFDEEVAEAALLCRIAAP